MATWEYTYQYPVAMDFPLAPLDPGTHGFMIGICTLLVPFFVTKLYGTMALEEIPIRRTPKIHPFEKLKSENILSL